MKRKYAKIAMALAAAVTISTPGAAIPGNTAGSRIEINGGRFSMNNAGTVMFSEDIMTNTQTVVNGGSFSAIDGSYVFYRDTNQPIADALKNVTINGGTFGPNTLDITNTEGPKAYFTDSEGETELTAGQEDIFHDCSSIRLTDDFLVTSVVLNGSDLGQSGKEITLDPGSLKIGDGEAGKNELVVTDFEGVSNTYVFYIDNTAPEVIETSISPDNGQLHYGTTTFTFEASEPIQSPGDGWMDVSEKTDGTKWEKVFDSNQKFTLTLTDLAGNTSDPVRFEVKRIEDVQLAAEVSYSNEGLQYTNQDVVVTIKTNVECKTPAGWKQTGSKRNQFEKTFSADAAETVTFVSLGGQTLEQEVTVSGIDKQAPAAYVNGTQAIDPGTVYSENISLKFSDNLALDKYELNGHMSPTNIAGNKWGDGNYQNIRNYLNLNGENTLTVWDMAGNQSQYTFIIDQTAPVIEVIVEDPDVMTPTKVVTLKGDEPFRVIKNETNKLTFTPENDDDGDGYATEWAASAGTTIWEGYTVEDVYGNQGTVGVTVSNVDSTVPAVNLRYSHTDPVKSDVFVFMDWNTGLSAETEEMLLADGWKKQNGLTYYREFSKNETLAYTNIRSHSGVPGGPVVVEVKNILCDVGVNYYIEAEQRYVEGSVEVLSDAATVNTGALTDIPEGYEVIYPGEVQINDGWIFVDLQKIVTTKEVGVNYYIHGEDRYVEGKVIVDKDATEVDLAALTDIPEGYEVIYPGEVQINDGWIFVDLQKIVTTKEVGVNYYIASENRYVEGKVIVDKDANNVNTSALTDIPAGYEPIWVGDVQINDGWIYVELRSVETGVAADFSDGI